MSSIVFLTLQELLIFLCLWNKICRIGACSLLSHWNQPMGVSLVVRDFL